MVELVVELDAIHGNSQAVAGLLRGAEASLVAVTKACLGEPRVAEAMMAGGAIALADTRDRNLTRLRAALPGVELHRIYLPPVSSAFVPGDLTYLSSVPGARALAALGSRARPLAVMVQLETGDQREGVPREQLEGLIEYVLGEPRLRLAGLSTNYACFAGVCTGVRASVEAVAAAARQLRNAGLELTRVSGGNSSLLALLLEGEPLPAEITELRCGEAVLLGQDALYYRPLPGCRQDACRLRAEVLEGYTKASPEGDERRLVLGLGSQDLGAGSLRFVEEGFYEAGRSADYLVVGVAPGGRVVTEGEVLEIIPSYYALSAAWTSPFVEVKLV